MKILKTFQIIIAIIGLMDITQNFYYIGGNVGCFGFNYTYYIRIFLLICSVFISFCIYKKEKTLKNILIYIPLIILIGGLLSYVFYQIQWIRIYEQWVGGGKTWSTFTERRDCNYFFMKLFEYTGPMK